MDLTMQSQGNNTTNIPSTQDEAVLIWLKENGTINPMQALNGFGCFRLSARIHNLKKQGYQISTKRISTMGRFGKVNLAEYHLDNAGDANG